MYIRNCLVCGSKFQTYPSRIKTGKGKFCSVVCGNKWKIGKFIPWNKGIKWKEMTGKNHPMFGRHHSEETKDRWSKIRKGRNLGNRWGFKKGMSTWNKGKELPQFFGNKNPAWKGDKVGYSGLHRWIYRHKGKAYRCEFCGKIKTTPKSIQWANKSQKYLRDLNDWISLCASCHKFYDSNFVQQ